MNLFILLLTFLLLLFPFNLMAETVEEKKFMEAKKALNRGDLTTFNLLKEELSYHPLIAYLDYYYISANFAMLDSQVIDDYVKQYPNSPMAAKLLKKKLLDFAAQKNWPKFIAHYHSSLNRTDLSCYYATALQKINDFDNAAKILKPLWLAGKNMPEACTEPFENWLEQNSNKSILIEQRFQAALKNYEFSVARFLINKMSDIKAQEAEEILKLYNNPNLITKKNYLNQQPSAEVISYGLFRLARRDPNYAVKIYQQLSKRYDFTQQQKQRIFQAIALKFALRKNSQSSIWFKKIVGFPLEEVYQEWMIRSALYHGDWKLVKNAIAAMPLSEKILPKWRYWYARALQKLGETKEAQIIYTELAQIRSYHGFLACLILKVPIHINHESLQVSLPEINEITNLAAYKRAHSLFRLNQKDEAHLELYYLIKQLSVKQQSILMQLISDWGWHSEVLRLAHYSHNKDNVKLRFPLLYQDIVIENAVKRQIDPALIYAIMRQESYFMENANSSAGAVGLMQLMPDTAYKTSKEYNLIYKGQEDLLNADSNIQFGSAHLHKLYRQFDNHPVLIIAAYNAGKNAVKRWLPKNNKTVPADVWIETVPFHETRNYLKQVIAGYIIYQFQLGKQTNLEKFMKEI